MHFDLSRFHDAQKGIFETALEEIKNGRKRSHWMWFIFPQLSGLGRSDTARYYSIKNFNEAEAFLRDPVLGKRLIEISTALLKLNGKTPNEIFGFPDDAKLHSSMTLFSLVENSDPVFQEVLNKYFQGRPDENTMRLLGSGQ